MGWLSMTRSGMATFATPKAYLDNQCTYTPDPEKGRDKGLRVLKSTVRSNAYYAACQSYTADGPEAQRHTAARLWADWIGERFGKP